VAPFPVSRVSSSRLLQEISRSFNGLPRRTLIFSHWHSGCSSDRSPARVWSAGGKIKRFIRPIPVKQKQMKVPISPRRTIEQIFRQFMFSLFTKTACAGLVAVVLSCSGGVARSSSAPAPEEIARVPFATVDKGVRSGLSERKLVIVVTAKEWKDLWLAHKSGVSSGPQAPQVDFQEEMVVGVFSGEKRTGGYGIEIKRVELEAGKQVLVLWAETSPAPGSMVMEALTQPYHIVRLKRLNLPVAFAPPGDSRSR